MFLRDAFLYVCLFFFFINANVLLPPRPHHLLVLASQTDPNLIVETS